MYIEFSSTSYHKLAEQLAEQFISSSPNPFQKEWIVVQNKETQQWVSLRLANQLGIATNLEFILPSELVWKLYRLTDSRIPKVLPADRNPLKWHIFEFLKTNQSLLTSLGLSTPDNDEGKSNLADQISDVFDLYQIYRPWMLAEWERERRTSFHKSEVWQSEIWRKLKSDWKGRYEFISDRAEVFDTLIQVVRNKHFPVELMPQRISVIGLSQWSHPFANLLVELSEVMELKHFIVDFENEEKGEKGSLFADWGSPKNNSKELLKIRDSNERIRVNAPKNRPSVRVHSTHNSRREVEVLKYYLLNLFQENPNLKPDEVLIMVPDLEEYGHQIKSVFGFDDEEPGIPVSLPYSNSDEELPVLQRLLEMQTSDLKVNEFIDFLELRLVAESFEISKEDISKIRKWLLQTNTHWGLKETDSPFSVFRSLNALFTGFTSELNDFETAYNLVPVPNINSTDDAILLGKLSSFIGKLEAISVETSTPNTVTQWVKHTRLWVFEFLGFSTALGGFLERLGEQMDLVPSQSPISFDVFKQWLMEQFSSQNASSTNLGNGIVVSTYIPYRNIPFKVKALLGFDEQAFPRKVIRPAFDLIDKEPKPGDRITKEDDALLFLETLTSTSDHLHISYVGQNEKSPKMVSMLIQQWMDIDSFIPAITHHKLHKFDTEYTTRTNYSKANTELARAINIEKDTKPFFNGFSDKEDANIQIRDLIEYFLHPARFLVERELQIRNPFEESELQDRELFKLDGLSRFKLNTELEYPVLQNFHKQELLDYFIKEGSLADTPTSKNQFEHSYSVTHSFIQKIREYVGLEPDALEVELVFRKSILEGRVGNLFESQRVTWRNGRTRAKDLLEAWINHLVLQVEGKEFESLFIAKGRNDTLEIQRLGIIQDAAEVLEELASLFEGRKSNKPFFPETSLAFVNAELNEKDGGEAAYKTWVGDDYLAGEGSDYYNQLMWRGLNPVASAEFAEISNRIWLPLLKNLEKEVHG